MITHRSPSNSADHAGTSFRGHRGPATWPIASVALVLMLMAPRTPRAEAPYYALIVHGGHLLKDDDPKIGIDNWRKTFERWEPPLPILIENTAGGDNAMARHLDYWWAFAVRVADQKATGFRFLNDLRGYSGTGMDNVEHYCLDCSFRPWLDATGNLTATLAIVHGLGPPGAPVQLTTERLTPDSSGAFRSRRTLQRGDTATITITDAWGDSTAAPVRVRRARRA